MTQTPRDWQKDMEMCKAATPGRWGWYEPTRCIYTARKDRDALDLKYPPPTGKAAEKPFVIRGTVE
ncbi:hypothetical protein [Paenibacillus sp. IHBB 3054]|uniref:hypothetical protein n=1 Tax=Paenibacillus sp. IHBB 3054 TaxID=3425689 RepID=UPI003F6622B6